MSFILQPWQLLVLILAGWINRQQQEAIEYLLHGEPSAEGEARQKRILLSVRSRNPYPHSEYRYLP